MAVILMFTAKCAGHLMLSGVQRLGTEESFG
jgi:hypothetical protein